MSKTITSFPAKTAISGTDIIPIVDMDGNPVNKKMTVDSLFRYAPSHDLTTASHVYINATTGNDSNDGISAGTALKTHAEFERRTAGKFLTPPLDPLAFNARFLTVHILSDLPDNDPINVRFNMAADSVLRYTGGIKQTLATGTFTAVTAMAPATNVPNQVTDSALSGGLGLYVGERIRITSGASTNAMAWIAKDQGSGSVRISNPVVWSPNFAGDVANYGNSVYFIFDLYPKVPVIGDHYAVEKLFEATIGVFEPNGVGPGDNYFFFSVTFDNIHFVGVGGWTTYGPGTPSWYVAQCKLDGSLYLKNVEEAYYLNCNLSQGVYSQGPSLISAIHAGLVGGGGIDNVGGSYLNLNSDVMVQGCGIRGKSIAIQSACVFDAVEGTATSGNGVDIGRIQIHTSQPAYLVGGMTLARTQTLYHDANIRLWGSGNAGFGVYVGPGCTFYIPENEPPYTMIPTITGTAGNFSLAGATTGRAWVESSGTWTAAITNTWAHLAATTGGGGFNGNAHNVAYASAIVKVPNP